MSVRQASIERARPASWCGTNVCGECDVCALASALAEAERQRDEARAEVEERFTKQGAALAKAAKAKRRAVAAEAALADTRRDRDEWRKSAEDGLVVIRRTAARLADTRQALRFYADADNYRLTLEDAARGRDTRAAGDAGHRARAVLAGPACQPEEES